MLLTIIIHEFGHALTTKHLGGTVDSIILWPLGGFALCSPTDKGPEGDLKVAIAGPLTHIPQILFWFIILVIAVGGDFSKVTFGVITFTQLHSGPGVYTAAVAMQAIVLNITLMIFNLFIPAYPLDGGRVLASTLLMKGVPPVKAAWITSITAMVISGILGIVGLVLYFGKNDSNGMFQIFIAIFIFGSSYQLFTLARSGNVASHPLFGRECYSDCVELGNSGTYGANQSNS